MEAIIKKIELIITLKEITDLISVEHNKAMKQVEKLSEEPSFGTVEKIATVYNDKNQTIKTYLLSKKQAIAIGAKLNNSLLMKVIDRLEELETHPKIKVPTSTMEALTMFIDVSKEQDMRLTRLEEATRLENWQERSLQDAKNKKVYEIADNDKELASKLHRKVWSLFKRQFHLPRYNELPSLKYDDGVSYINNLTLADMVG
ncbi:ORF6C domain-containing protein [Sulfurimonas sp.]|jgi:hypothetical protein|uniref:ORF6C domain-containing protein n=1 Tax=Sulfurimonas sp. TaxID=2022749 RepID=UPI0025D7FABE|nr:ORF6C domain-containing protein [Sulfurimonas sp.]MBT5934979.1 hypothetical protein [Sulfurimonas sp.]